ncbi:PKD domain-containing protein [Pleionea sediminis]|uniref:PKD domain-containing protein n=1 Tax=Pleionea sediminis TaxID=2569479 RepID=UPI0011847DEF|nr:proprotein convertase P-domain-containing protein [Pleionea sediminis]
MGHFKKNTLSKVILSTLLASGSTLALAEQSLSEHTDHRQSSKIVHFKLNNHKHLNNPLSAIQGSKLHGELNELLNQVSLYKTKKSLTATHYHYQQKVNGIPVWRGELIVSIDNSDASKVRVFNNLYPYKSAPQKSKSTLSANRSLELSWQNLQSNGELQAEPKAELVYLPVGQRLELVYVTRINATAPRGEWEQIINANTGKLIQVYRTDLPIDKSANAKDKKWQFKHNKAAVSFTTALSQFQAKTAQKTQKQGVMATGSALVFDPDPRTTLNDGSLVDTSPDSAFDAAYVTRTLEDITLADGTYSLQGPWVSIEDWDSPTSAPSTSTTGNWDQKRGDVAFNDVMTYFHVDQNQRYMQSLGFTGDSGIQEGAIVADANGANGDDNSYFQPGANRMAFGHGCVDDNEDADVILHEYGHAINHSINSNWSGGDTGAMGEGFGDYWAGSYSYSTANGPTFNPNWVFTWDGHSSCWAGRVMDQTGFTYDHSQNYGAHATVNGELGDELWSTPLFQSLIELINQGQTREEVDQIILEAQFGLGSGLKMRDLAGETVATAATLFPDGPHAQVLSAKFRQVSILESFLAEGELVVSNTGNDGDIDPGETFNVQIPMENIGQFDITNVTGTLSSTTANIEIPVSESGYPDLSAGETANNTSLFEVSVPANHVCGAPIDLALNVEYTANGTAESLLANYQLPTGQTATVTETNETATSIPDNDPDGVTSTITFDTGDQTIDADSFSIDLNISHTWIGDLTIRLTGPDDTSVLLRSPSGGSADDIIGNIPGDFDAAESLAAFEGKTLAGEWTLSVVDGAGQDTGTINSWAINLAGETTCIDAENTAPVVDLAADSITVDEGESVSLDASGSTDAEGHALSFSWTQISGDTITLENANSAVANFTAPTVSDTSEAVFEVTVSDGFGGSSTAQVTVTINDINQVPVAEVTESSLSVEEGENVTLDASPSSDPDGDDLTFSWTQISGDTITLENATTAQASFTAPSVDEATDFIFEVTVSDPSGASNTQQVTVTVDKQNQLPVAQVANASIEVDERGTVTLNASSSSDPDGDQLTFSWAQTSGTNVTLQNANSALATFTAPSVTADSTLGFEVTVSDSKGGSSTAQVTVTVKNKRSGGGSGGGSLAFGSILLLGLTRLLRKTK